MGKRGNEFSQVRKEELDAVMEKSSEAPKGPFGKASSDVLKNRRIVRAKRPIGVVEAPTVDPNNPFASVALLASSSDERARSSSISSSDNEMTQAKTAAAELQGSNNDSKKLSSSILESRPLLYTSSHPVLLHKITALRSASTDPGSFRSLMKQITQQLGYEATQNLKVRTGLAVTLPQQSFAASTSSSKSENNNSNNIGVKLVDKVALVPILRSGLGMTDSFLELLPNSAVHHIGMYRSDNQPVQYFNKLPRQCFADVAYVLDPVIGTGSTVLAVVSILKKWGVPKIHIVTVIASKPGLEALVQAHPDVHVTIGMIDDGLTKDGMVIPGMGDVGDRLFGTGNCDF